MKQKRWLRRKGCKNCALVSIKRHCSDWCEVNCEGHPDEVVIQPYYKDREFIFISKRCVPAEPRTYMKNAYFNEKGNLVKISGDNILTPQETKQ